MDNRSIGSLNCNTSIPVASSSLIRRSSSTKIFWFELETLPDKEIKKHQMDVEELKQNITDTCAQKKLLYSKDDIYYRIEDEMKEKPVEIKTNNEIRCKRKISENKKTKRVSFKGEMVDNKENLKISCRNLRNNRSVLKKKKILKKTDVTASSPTNDLVNFTGAFERQLASPMNNNNNSNCQPKTGSRTPLTVTRRTNYKIAEVTPKPYTTNAPTILRRPKSGEMAISLHGSPLLTVTTNDPTRVPQINIPLGDGRVMTVFGEEKINPEEFPELKGTETLAQLKRLHQFLSKAIQ